MDLGHPRLDRVERLGEVPELDREGEVGLDGDHLVGLRIEVTVHDDGQCAVGLHGELAVFPHAREPLLHCEQEAVARTVRAHAAGRRERPVGAVPGRGLVGDELDGGAGVLTGPPYTGQESALHHVVEVGESVLVEKKVAEWVIDVGVLDRVGCRRSCSSRQLTSPCSARKLRRRLVAERRGDRDPSIRPRTRELVNGFIAEQTASSA